MFGMAGVLEREDGPIPQLDLYNYYFRSEKHIYVRKESVCMCSRTYDTNKDGIGMEHSHAKSLQRVCKN